MCLQLLNLPAANFLTLFYTFSHLPVDVPEAFCVPVVCAQCFDAVGWPAGRASGL